MGNCKNTRKMWMIVLLAAIFSAAVDGIRVYEGTKFEDLKPKPHKSVSLTKKSLNISKRSWITDDNVKSLPKADKRADERWKEMSKRKGKQDSFPILYKIIFKQKEFVQYIKYAKEVPVLEEYTFCLWYKPSNMAHDHTLFSYSVNKKEKLLRFWINAADSTLRMSIRDNLVYKVPANIRKNKWHHICQSWHGISGEWQIYLDGKKIGAGVLTLYKETYVPEGGEITLGQAIVDMQKNGFYKNGALEGELFGFNLVNEAVPGEQAVFINSQYKPKLKANVPPFKKLPPIKKTYEEIKAYISKLPSPVELGKGVESKPYSGEDQNIIARSREPTSMKRHKGISRIRYPPPPPPPPPPSLPVRKVVIYNRNDRKLPLDESLIRINETSVDWENEKTALEKAQGGNLTRSDGKSDDQPYDENYSIHSYRVKKGERKSTNYEIYESLEDDLIKSFELDNGTDRNSIERKARENFDLFTAREANKVYTLSNSVKDARKPKFHFESEPLERTLQKNVVAEEVKTASQIRQTTADDMTTKRAQRKVSDSIPVYETEVVLLRRKRSSEISSNPLVDGFRRLPQIPDSFIEIFTKNATKTELEQKLNQFFPQNVTKENSEEQNLRRSAISAEDLLAIEIPVSTTYKTHSSTPLNPSPSPITDRPETAENSRPNDQPLFQVPISKSPVQSFPVPDHTYLTQTMPINFPDASDDVMEFDPRKKIEDRSSFDWYARPETNRRKFQVSSATDLIMRSYGLCTSNRGSPIQQKDHLVISWADTPIRIFGGAEIENARNECGNF